MKIFLLFKKNYDILYSYYDMLNARIHNFDAGYHNILQDILIHFQIVEIFLLFKIFKRKNRTECIKYALESAG